LSFPTPPEDALLDPRERAAAGATLGLVVMDMVLEEVREGEVWKGGRFVCFWRGGLELVERLGEKFLQRGCAG